MELPSTAAGPPPDDDPSSAGVAPAAGRRADSWATSGGAGPIQLITRRFTPATALDQIRWTADQVTKGDVAPIFELTAQEPDCQLPRLARSLLPEHFGPGREDRSSGVDLEALPHPVRDADWYKAQTRTVPPPMPCLIADRALWAWTPSQLAKLSRLTDAAGASLVFVEPTAGVGWRQAVQRAAGPWWQRRYGHRFVRDIPAELRAVGFVVTTLVRFRHGPVRHYVWGEARHYPRWPGSDGGLNPE